MDRYKQRLIERLNRERLEAAQQQPQANLFDMGGDTDGDELKNLSDEEKAFMLQKARDIQAEILRISRDENTVPYINGLNPPKYDYVPDQNYLYRMAESILKEAYGSTGLNPSFVEILNKKKELENSFVGPIPSVYRIVQYGDPTCINTATGIVQQAVDNFSKDFYKKSRHQVPGNMTFVSNPSKYGFKKVSNPLPGDLIQALGFNNQNPYHAMIFDGFDEKGDMLFNYSNGGQDKNDYHIKSHYPLSEGFNTFRFVGNQIDSLNWHDDYIRQKNILDSK